MKKNDIAIVLAVAGFAAIFSLVLSNMLFASNSKKLKAQKVDPITAQFETPDKRYFNAESINPTQLIQIGDGTNQQPF